MTPHKKWILEKLSQFPDLMKASLAESHRTCGKSGCKCQKGEKHIGYFLSYRLQGKMKTLYVPKTAYPNIQQLISNWKQIKTFIEELTDLNASLVKKGQFQEDDK